MGLIDEVGPGPVALDTAIFIYLIEEHPQYLRPVLPLFEAADAGRRELATSGLTLLEVLVVPYRRRNLAIAERYEVLLTRSRGVRLVELTRDQLRAAAQLRAASGAKTPDALQIVAAMSAGCRTLVTDDRRMPQISGLRIIQLSTVL